MIPKTREAMLFLISVFIIVQTCNAFFESYMFQRTIPSIYFNTRCLIGQFEFASVFRQGISTGICEKVSVAWNYNKTFGNGYFYVWMKWYETPFTKNVRADALIPKNFNVGCHIDVIVETPSVVDDGFYINIKDSTRDVIFIHLSVRPDSNFTVLNTIIDGNWSDEYHVKIPAPEVTTSPNTVYNTSFFLRSTHWDVYIDDDFLSNFTHVYAFNGTGEVEFVSQSVYCNRIMFFGVP